MFHWRISKYHACQLKKNLHHIQLPTASIHSSSQHKHCLHGPINHNTNCLPLPHYPPLWWNCWQLRQAIQQGQLGWSESLIRLSYHINTKLDSQSWVFNIISIAMSPKHYPVIHALEILAQNPGIDVQLRGQEGYWIHWPFLGTPKICGSRLASLRYLLYCLVTC